MQFCKNTVYKFLPLEHCLEEFQVTLALPLCMAREIFDTITLLLFL